jgi:hypothetical protein
MSGRKQHYIPQSILKQFETPSTGKTKKAWVFSKSKTFLSPTKDIAAERHFYSEPSILGAETLDDAITRYENRLSDVIFSLRQVAMGAEANAQNAAEIVTHLIIRNAALRRNFTDAFQSALDHAIDLFCSEANLRALIGVDAKQFPPRIAEMLDEHIAKDPQFSQTGLPRAILHKIALMAMKENFSRVVVENLPFMRSALKYLHDEAPTHVKSTHNKALSAGVLPDIRIAALTKLHWIVHSAPSKGAILPDCVALGREGENAPQPLILCDLEDLSYVLMPLSAARILVGSRVQGAAPDLTKFNHSAATSSQSFFVSNRTGADLDELIPYIGECAKETVGQAIRSAFEGFSSERQLNDRSQDNDTDSRVETQRTPEPITGATEPPLQYSTSFHGVSNEETAQRIAATLWQIVQELRPMMPLDRLDGFTFAEEYDVALANLDRGFQAHAELKATKEEYGEGVAMSPEVLRDGVLKHHVVAKMWIAYGLISPDEDTQNLALHTIIHQLAYIACTQLLEDSLPGIITASLEDPYEAFLYPYADCIWRGYFAARASAPFDPTTGDAYAKLVEGSLEKARTVILPARLAYRFDGNLDRLLEAAFPPLVGVLEHVAHLLGHAEALRYPLERYGVASTFEKAGLRPWLELLQSDLQLIWDHSGRWKSIDEFLILNRHVERLLWQVGLFPWKTPEGLIRVEVPLITDVIYLTGTKPKLRGIVASIRGIRSMVCARLARLARHPRS